MLWFYSQDSLTIRIETRYDNRTAEYVLVVHWSADHRHEERFATAVLFRTSDPLTRRRNPLLTRRRHRFAGQRPMRAPSHGLIRRRW